MNLQLVPALDYVAQATERIAHAQSRVSLMAMVIADHPATHDLIETAIAAARRGVEVHVTADVFTYGEVSGTFLPLWYRSKGSRAATSMARRLKAAGVRFTWLGHGRVTMFNGRTHSKWTVIDDTVFTFGGVNLFEDGVANNDFMFRFDDHDTAELLLKEQRRIIRAERSSQNFSSHSHQLDDHSTILFDGGIIAHSLIYRRTCELADQATDMTFVSQYCPTGKLARILRTKPYDIYFNRTSQATFLNRVMLRVNTWLSGLRTAYARDQYLHAKYIIFTMPDNSKIAITGSHNFAYTGVLFGTREIALETKDPAIIRQLESFTKDHVA